MTDARRTAAMLAGSSLPVCRQLRPEQMFRAGATVETRTTACCGDARPGPQQPRLCGALAPAGRPDRAASCCRGSPAGEDEMRSAAGAAHCLPAEAVFEPLEPVPEPFPAARHDGHHDDVQVIDKAGGQELADDRRAAADADVPPSRGRARRGQSPGRAGAVEMECGAALHLERGPGMTGEDEDRGVEHRVVSPPAFPLLVHPGAALRPELVPPHDLRADARPPVAGKGVVHARAATGLAVHDVEGPSGEKPLLQPVTRVPEGSIEALPLSFFESVDRHREVMDAHPRHGDLLTAMLSNTTGAGCPASATPAPVRTIRRARTHRHAGYGTKPAAAARAGHAQQPIRQSGPRAGLRPDFVQSN